MNKTTEALKLAEEIFSGMLHGTDWNNGTHANIYRPKFPKALAAIREALADHSGGANEMVAEPAIPEWVDVDDYEEPVKQEPVAEGYMKCPACNDRGVIRQHFTELERMLIEDAFEKAVKKAAPVQQAEQEPVAVVDPFYIRQLDDELELGAKLYTHPVRTKDLTDEEIWEIWFKDITLDWDERCRAVIEKFKEKNK